jgi:hypothetical protein
MPRSAYRAGAIAELMPCIMGIIMAITIINIINGIIALIMSVTLLVVV